MLIQSVTEQASVERLQGSKVSVPREKGRDRSSTAGAGPRLSQAETY